MAYPVKRWHRVPEAEAVGTPHLAIPDKTREAVAELLCELLLSAVEREIGGQETTSCADSQRISSC
jgi:hypothetical protein